VFGAAAAHPKSRSATSALLLTPCKGFGGELLAQSTDWPQATECRLSLGYHAGGDVGAATLAGVNPDA
jgi:hypothetical protein